MWPMKAVSIRDATGSAISASAAGKAILMISIPSSSNLKACLCVSCIDNQEQTTDKTESNELKY